MDVVLRVLIPLVVCSLVILLTLKKKTEYELTRRLELLRRVYRCRDELGNCLDVMRKSNNLDLITIRRSMDDIQRLVDQIQQMLLEWGMQGESK